MSTTEKVSQIWEALAGQRQALVQAFYTRLFQEYPHYRQLFPQSMDGQMEKMVGMMGAVARFSDRIDMIRPYLLRVAYTHKNLEIDERDLENFRTVLLESIANFCPDDWDDETEVSFNRAFDDTIIPIFKEGMEI
ncbi:MAG: globin domain-containing protein [Gammaproteobacteria bacterium]|nr:globin domain-containing protein [Gammaproteobacteria bacterium]